MSRRRLTIVMFTCLVLGLVLMLGFELALLGVPLLFGFIVAGVFLIADPAELTRERSD